MQKEFHTLISLDEARAVVLASAPRAGHEIVPLERAFGRVLDERVVSKIDVPGFDRAAMDGYALRSAETLEAREDRPVAFALIGAVPMGERPDLVVGQGEAAEVSTGSMMPEGADAVVMVENAEVEGGSLLIRRAVHVGENTHRAGGDVAFGETVLLPGRKLTAREIGLLAAVGRSEVRVRSLKVAVASTGNELVSVRDVPGEGKVRDSNGPMIAAYLRRCGCREKTYGIVPDDREALALALRNALAENDAVFLSGGSSKDERDLTADLIGELGQVLVHGIAISPGKPTIIGRCGEKPVIGLPGHPASALVVLDRVARPLLAALSGETSRVENTVLAVLAENIPSARGREDYVRVRLEGGRAVPLFGKSGLLNTLAESDGMVRVPAGSEGLEAGTTVGVLLW